MRSNVRDTVWVGPDCPQSEIAATNFYDSGGSLGEELGEELGEIFWAFSCFVCCTEWPTNLLPKFLPIYHTMSCDWNEKKSHLRELLGLGGRKLWEQICLSDQSALIDAYSLSKGISFKTCANPPARDQNINRAHLYEKECLLNIFAISNCSGAPLKKKYEFSLSAKLLSRNYFCDPAGLLQSPRIPETPKIRKKYEIPHPGFAPENTKKIPKIYKNDPKTAILCRFCIFRCFFHMFGRQPGVGDFVFFSYFRSFAVLGLCSRPAWSQIIFKKLRLKA